MVLGIIETRWTQIGLKRIDSREMLLSKETRKALIGWGISWMPNHQDNHQNKGQYTMNVIQCYALINDSNDDDKDKFYERLQLIAENCL